MSRFRFPSDFGIDAILDVVQPVKEIIKKDDGAFDWDGTCFDLKLNGRKCIWSAGQVLGALVEQKFSDGIIAGMLDARGLHVKADDVMQRIGHYREHGVTFKGVPARTDDAHRANQPLDAFPG